MTDKLTQKIHMLATIKRECGGYKLNSYVLSKLGGSSPALLVVGFQYQDGAWHVVLRHRLGDEVQVQRFAAYEKAEVR